MPLTDPTELSLNGSAASYVSWGNTTDRAARMQPAHAAFNQKWLDMADGDPLRAEAYRRAHFKRLALRSVQARRRGTAR